MSMELVGCRIKDNCPLVGPGPVGGMTSGRGIFLRDPSPYLCKFRRNHKKIQTARLTSRTRD